jgi:hypothetical protein
MSGRRDLDGWARRLDASTDEEAIAALTPLLKDLRTTIEALDRIRAWDIGEEDPDSATAFRLAMSSAEYVYWEVERLRAAFRRHERGGR